jgi:hypothetical protein
MTMLALLQVNKIPFFLNTAFMMLLLFNWSMHAILRQAAAAVHNYYAQVTGGGKANGSLCAQCQVHATDAWARGWMRRWTRRQVGAVAFGAVGRTHLAARRRLSLTRRMHRLPPSPCSLPLIDSLRTLGRLVVDLA